MRNLLFFCIIAMASFVFYGCGGGSGSSNQATTDTKEEAKPTPTDYQMLSKEAEFKKVYDIAIEKLGGNIKHVSELTFRMNRESEDSGNAEGTDYLTVKVQYLHPTNKNKLEEYSYWSSSAKWEDSPTTVEVSPVGDPESFRLEDSLMDLSSLTFEKLNKAVQDTYAKFKDDNKYTYQYVYYILIEEGEVTIAVQGKLKANEQLKYETNKMTIQSILQ